MVSLIGRRITLFTLEVHKKKFGTTDLDLNNIEVYKKIRLIPLQEHFQEIKLT